MYPMNQGPKYPCCDSPDCANCHGSGIAYIGPCSVVEGAILPSGSSRRGTAIGTKDRLTAILGDPVECNADSDGKVTFYWRIRTPRSTGEVCDYWWKRRYELSIRAPDRKTAVWIAAFLRHHGIPAWTRTPPTIWYRQIHPTSWIAYVKNQAIYEATSRGLLLNGLRQLFPIDYSKVTWHPLSIVRVS